MKNRLDYAAAAIWVAENYPLLVDAGLLDPDDLRVKDPIALVDEALESTHEIYAGDGTEDDPPIFLDEHALHTIMAVESRLVSLCWDVVRTKTR